MPAVIGKVKKYLPRGWQVRFSSVYVDTLVPTSYNGFMEDSINLLDYVFVVAPCPECGQQIRLPFSWTLTPGRKVDCPVCGYPYGLVIGGDLAPNLEKGFQRLQEQIREKGCWVEVHSYP